MREVGAERFEVLLHTFEHEIRLAPQARPAIFGEPSRASDCRDDAGREIVALVPVEEHKWARLDRIGMVDGASDQVLGREGRDRGAGR